MYIALYVYMHVSTYQCLCVFMYECMHARVCVCVHAYMYVSDVCMHLQSVSIRTWSFYPFMIVYFQFQRYWKLDDVIRGNDHLTTTRT